MTLKARAKFVKTIAIILIIYSALWSLAPYSSINLPARFILDMADWPIDNLATPLSRNMMWMSSISAGLLIAISVFFYGIVAPAVLHANKPIIKTTIVAMLLWYAVDSFGSIAAGVLSNAVFNTIYLILILFPLIGIKQKKP